MSEYKVKITELLETTVTVETDTADTAMDRVRTMYRNSEIILTADDHTDTEFTAVAEEQFSDEEGVCGRICACGHKSFAARQVSYHNVVVTDGKVFDAGIQASRQPYSPFVCIKCNKTYEDRKPGIQDTGDPAREGDM